MCTTTIVLLQCLYIHRAIYYTHRFESKGLVEYEPDPDHFDEDGSIAEGVPQRGQPWVDLGVSRYVFG